ncbi:MAG: glycoside hydrolase family 130 protein [Candidatus Azobacteroides sp.]|nr:glycoside hydrolase family 130 protein [Candidatus Azobacteroides sp.]
MIYTGKIFTRSVHNPVLTPQSIPASQDKLKIECLLNPGVFRFNCKIGLLVRVAERPVQKEGLISFPYLDASGRIEIKEIQKDNPELQAEDPRVITYRGEDYLTTMSHLCPVFSEDGIHFNELPEYKRIYADDSYTSFGIEDCRVSQIGEEYLLTYTAVSPNGVGVGLKTTRDWKTFTNYGLIFPPHNKDCAIFEEKVNNRYMAFHRPSSPEIGGNYLWLAESPDLIHWGNHRCIARTREGKFDSARLGAGCAPIRTDKGWLSIYHGATEKNRYCLGALLLDTETPSIVLARSETPIMEPELPYETTGFFGEVIFTNGHLLDGDELTIYYGAADEVICMAKASVTDILNTLSLK